MGTSRHTVEEVSRVLECEDYSVETLYERARWLIDEYRGMCNTLRACALRHRLGLGGERLDELVCNALDRANGMTVVEEK